MLVDSQPMIKCLAIPLVLALLVACGGSSADFDTPSPPPTPSNMDLMCAEAVEEMRRLLKKGGMNITRYDPNGQLASLVETCLQEGRG